MSTSLSAEKSFVRWDAIRKQGRRAHIIKYGILGWGIPVAVVLTAWDWYCGQPLRDLAALMGLRLVLFGILGGIAFGACMWKIMELMHEKAQQRQLSGTSRER